MIRPATLADIPRVMELGREFADDAGVTARIGWNDQDVSAMLETLIEDENGILLLSENGMIGGFVAPHPFNNDCLVFSELFWRAKDGNGLALLAEAEKIAAGLGATRSLMVAMDGMDRTRRLYGKIGYGVCEVHYMKEIG